MRMREIKEERCGKRERERSIRDISHPLNHEIEVLLSVCGFRGEQLMEFAEKQSVAVEAEPSVVHACYSDGELIHDAHQEQPNTDTDSRQVLYSTSTKAAYVPTEVPSS